MLNHVRSTVKDTLIYSLGNISTKILGIVLMPIYTEQLPLEEYGALGILEITIQLFIPLFSFAIFQGLTRWYWDEDYRSKQRSIFFTCLLFIVVTSALLLAGLLPFTDQLSILLINQDRSYLMGLILVSASFQMIARLILVLLRLQRKPGMFTTINIVKLAITLFLTIYFVVNLERGLEGIFEAQIIGFVAFFLMVIPYVVKNIEVKLEKEILKDMLRFSYPLAISTALGVFFSVTDRYALKFVGGLAEAGIYSLGFKIANTLKIFIMNSAQSALEPFKMKMIGKPGSKRFYSKIMLYYGFGTMLFILLISFFGKEVIVLLARKPEYIQAYKIIPVISMALLFQVFRNSSNIGLIIQKKTGIMSRVVILIAIINVGLNLLFISLFDMMGAAVAVLLSQILFFVIIFRYAQREYPIPYEIPKLIKMVLLGAVFIVIGLLTNDMNLLLRIPIKLLLVVIYPFALYPLGFYEPIEVLRMKQAWHKWKNPLHWKKNISNLTRQDNE